ncbi:hypothetical protein SAMN05216350_10876 [Polaromonas sp. YR568]|uniref:hypothetical protein n=1 Tax=Polaromonas sp. YR568 TaxID=1855301 RepID=UPI0008E34A11|nr:hypothetical protein [Polaromonas sp. YR568]SFU91637.1 hypothetical protein SAMN05216350_10876 [Polaromonas sp. YR568]
MLTEPNQVIVLAVLEYGELPELLRVAETAGAALQCRAAFFFVKRGYRRLAQDTAAVTAAGFLWMDAEGRLHDVAAPPRQEPEAPLRPVDHAGSDLTSVLPAKTAGRSVLGRSAAVILLPLFSLGSLARSCAVALRQLARDLANCRRDMVRFRQRYRELHAVLAEIQPRLLIVGQDSLGGELSFLLIAAGRLGIPRLVTPFAMFSLQETAEYAGANAAHDATAGAVNKLVANTFPHWVLSYGGKNLLRLPGYRALALEMTGLIEGLPWSALSEPVEAIAAGSEVAVEALIALGSQRSALRVIGSPIQDRLANMLANRAALRSRLGHEFGLDPEKPLIVCGWPVNMFAWLAGRPVDYADYPSVATAWAQALAEVRDQHGVNVIVSVHPKTLPSEIAEAERVGLPCRGTGADELIAAADLFTTLNGSSITAWAIACGVPVVLFDCFLTRYHDFLSVPGCLNVETEAAFRAALRDLSRNGEARAALAAHQREVAGQWGNLDGHAGTRLAALVRQLAAGAQP